MRARHSRLRKTSSSSTTNASGFSSDGGICDPRGGKRQFEAGRRAAAGNRGKCEAATQPFRQDPDQKRPQSHAFARFFGGKEGFGDAPYHVLSHSGALILNADVDTRTRPMETKHDRPVVNVGVQSI